MGNDRQFDGIERLNRGVGVGEKKRLEIERVTRQLERDDLPPAVAGHFMPMGEAGQEDGTNVAPFAFANDDAARVETAQRKGKRRDRILVFGRQKAVRSEEHTSELQSLMRISYAVFCLKKKNTTHKCMNYTY